MQNIPLKTAGGGISNYSYVSVTRGPYVNGVRPEFLAAMVSMYSDSEKAVFMKRATEDELTEEGRAAIQLKFEEAMAAAAFAFDAVLKSKMEELGFEL